MKLKIKHFISDFRRETSLSLSDSKSYLGLYTLEWSYHTIFLGREEFAVCLKSFRSILSPKDNRLKSLILRQTIKI